MASKREYYSHWADALSFENRLAFFHRNRFKSCILVCVLQCQKFNRHASLELKKVQFQSIGLQYHVDCLLIKRFHDWLPSAKKTLIGIKYVGHTRHLIWKFKRTKPSWRPLELETKILCTKRCFTRKSFLPRPKFVVENNSNFKSRWQRTPRTAPFALRRQIFESRTANLTLIHHTKLWQQLVHYEQLRTYSALMYHEIGARVTPKLVRHVRKRKNN